MTKKESKMLYFLMAMVFLTLLVKGTPIAVNYYETGLSNIELLIKKTEQLDKILSRNKYWKKEYSKIKSAEEKKLIQLFSAKSRELVAAKLQTLLKKLARESGTNIESTLLPEFKKNEQWLIITQNISIKGNSKNIFNFLKTIESNQKKLIINHINLRSNHQQLRGSLTIVSFSRKVIKVEKL